MATQCLMLWYSGVVFAHSGFEGAIPRDPGWRLSADASVSAARTRGRLPSEGLPGYLAKGDSGFAPNGTQIEHAVVQAGYRFNDRMGAQLAMGVHGSDPVHVEAAWLAMRGDRYGTDWMLGAGRQQPSLGPVLAAAGHFERSGRMPLARQAQTAGTWIENGLELGVRPHFAGADWSIDLGVWAGRSFPGSDGSSGARPSAHVGVARPTAWGDWTIDGFVAWLHPGGRGKRIMGDGPHQHTHEDPVCDQRLDAVVCLDARSRISGFSLQWTPPSSDLIVRAVGLQRSESGSLMARDGVGRYVGLTQGGWLEAIHPISPSWVGGARVEWLTARQRLEGPGASMVAAQAGIDRYAPVNRIAVMATYRIGRYSAIQLEAGRESSRSTGREENEGGRFVAARWVVGWQKDFRQSSPP
jgi:hypothetical protein